jgi:hypothetical protein
VEFGGGGKGCGGGARDTTGRGSHARGTALAFYGRRPRCLKQPRGMGVRPRAAAKDGGAGRREGPTWRARRGRHAAGRGIQGRSGACVLGMRTSRHAALWGPGRRGTTAPRGRARGRALARRARRRGATSPFLIPCSRL